MLATAICYLHFTALSDDWLAIDESLSENLISSAPDGEGDESSLSSSSASLSVASSSRPSMNSQGGRSPNDSYRYIANTYLLSKCAASPIIKSMTID